MTIRTIVEADLDAINTLLTDKSVNTVTVERFAEYLEAGMYRHEWTAVAEADGEIQALAVWWGPPEHDHPMAIDGLYWTGEGDPVPVWTELIRFTLAMLPPGEAEYHIFLPNGWKEQADLVAAIEPRRAAAAAAGLTETTERLRYEWKAEYGLPPRSERLRFEPGTDEQFLDVFRRVSEGSLDAATAREIGRSGLDQAVREELELYKEMPGERDWWRLCYDQEGQLVGFGLPSANAAGPVVGYLGVVPEARGRGYIDDVLSEVTHILAETGATQIRADTDLGNKPMAASFERLGYRNFAARLVFSVPAS